MDIAKIQQALGNCAGILFGLGLTLIIAWNSAQDPNTFQLFSHPAFWGAFGAFTSLLTMGNWIQLQRTNQIVSESTSSPKNASSVFQFLSLLSKLDKSAAQFLASLIFFGVGAFLHYQTFKNGNWIFSIYVKVFGLGWFGSLLLFPFLKNKFGTLNDNPSLSSKDAVPNKWKGSFLVTDTKNGIKLTLPIVGALTPDQFSIVISDREIKRFKVIQTKEEATVLRARKVDGNLELIGKGLLEKAAFHLKPENRPNHYISDFAWNPGDVMLLIEGEEIFYYLAVQNQYLPILKSIETRFKII